MTAFPVVSVNIDGTARVNEGRQSAQKALRWRGPARRKELVNRLVDSCYEIPLKRSHTDHFSNSNSPKIIEENGSTFIPDRNSA